MIESYKMFNYSIIAVLYLFFTLRLKFSEHVKKGCGNFLEGIILFLQ